MVARSASQLSRMDATLQQLVDRWPVLAGQLRDALGAEGEESLVAQVETLCW